jgi:hypothetical protein
MKEHKSVGGSVVQSSEQAPFTSESEGKCTTFGQKVVHFPVRNAN